MVITFARAGGYVNGKEMAEATVIEFGSAESERARVSISRN